MDLFVIVGIIISVSLSSAFHDHTLDDYYDYTDDFFKDTSPPLANKPTPPPPGRYEVTEIVDDIPDPNLTLRPIATNFTVNKPLNVVNATNNLRKDISSRDNPKFRKDFVNIPIDTGKEAPKEIMDYSKNPDYEFNYEDSHGYPNVLPVIKTYLSGLEKGIVNGVNSVVGKNIFNAQVSEPSRSSTPVWFLDKLGDTNKQSGDVPHDYEFDDIFSH